GSAPENGGQLPRAPTEAVEEFPGSHGLQQMALQQHNRGAQRNEHAGQDGQSASQRDQLVMNLSMARAIDQPHAPAPRAPKRQSGPATECAAEGGEEVEDEGKRHGRDRSGLKTYVAAGAGRVLFL